MKLKAKCECGKTHEIDPSKVDVHNRSTWNTECECGRTVELHASSAFMDQMRGIADGVFDNIFGSSSQKFAAVFVKQVHCCFSSGPSTGDAWLAHEMVLPFAPVPQMIFTDLEAPEWHAQALEVQWDGRMFVVYTEANREIYNAQANRTPTRDIKAIVADYETMGWRMLGHGASPKLYEEEKEESDEE